MATRTTLQGQQVFGHFEPSMSYEVLRGCECGSPHPRALGLASTNCPSCGMPSLPPGPTRHVRAKITGWRPSAIAARFCLWAGERLAALVGSMK